MRIKRLFALLLALALLCAGCAFMAEEPLDPGEPLDRPLDEPILTDPQAPEEPEDLPPETPGPGDQAPDETAPEEPAGLEEPGTQEPDTREPEAPEAPDPDGSQDADHSWAPEYGGYYYDVASVVLYLEAYGELPANYITKKQAQELGWSGGSVEDYLEGAAIGGDRFGNYEGLLPEDASYTECDIDTDGYGSRGARRLVFSDDGHYYYTSDHYETFTEVTVTEDHQVQW